MLTQAEVGRAALFVSACVGTGWVVIAHMRIYFIIVK
jgi:hypothetical protein